MLALRYQCGYIKSLRFSRVSGSPVLEDTWLKDPRDFWSLSSKRGEEMPLASSPQPLRCAGASTKLRSSSGAGTSTFESRTSENESVANVQRIMQGPAYQEKERRAATWNAAGCGSGLSESDMELVRDQSRPKDRCLAEINGCVLTGDAHGTFKAAAVVGSKITNMVVKLIGSHEHMN